MLHILLTILKVLGIVLLSILGIILLLLVLVLFVPIRYNINASKDEEIKASVTVSWLLHFVHAKVKYDNGLDISARLLGIKIFPLKKNKPKKEKVKKVKKSKSKTSVPEKDKKPIDVVEERKPIADKEEPRIVDDSLKNNEALLPEADAYYEGEAEKQKEKKSFFEKISDGIQNIKNKIQGIIDKIKNTITSIKTFFRNLNKNIKHYFELITDESNKSAIKYLWDRLKDLIKHILPQKHKIELKYGNEDPAKLADIIGYVAMFKSATNINLNFQPEFNRDVLEGNVHLKGRLRLFFVVCIAFKVYKNKDFRKLLKNFTK